MIVSGKKVNSKTTVEQKKEKERKGSSFCFSRSENCNKRQLGNAACYWGVNAACFSLQELHTEADREEASKAAPILTLAPCQRSSDPGRRRREGERVGIEGEGANISLAGSPGHGGGQGSAGEGEDACPAVN